MSDVSFIPSQAVILAAGESSRFTPFSSRNTHKSSFELMGSSIIFQTLQALEQLGVMDVLIIRSSDDTALEKACSLSPFSSLNIQFHIQNRALGMGNALLSAKDSLQKRFLVVNPQQVNIGQHLENLKQLQEENNDRTLVLFSQETKEPQKYGMLRLEGNRVLDVIEKPKNNQDLSDQRILGIYVLTQNFLQFMSTLEISEYQFEDALNQYAKQETIIAIESLNSGLSLKYPWDLFTIAHYLFLSFQSKEPIIDSTAVVHSTAILTGQVIIAAGARIYEYALIQGPCYIGKNVVVGSYCKVRAETILEEGVELQNNVEIKHSIIGKATHIHSGFIGDSVVGENCRIGASFITANRRLDRENIRVSIKKQLVDTNQSFFGTLIGDTVKIGIHCGTNPGTIITSDTTILPATIISVPKQR